MTASCILGPCKAQEDAVLLQQDLDALQRWESDWAMEFAQDKCKQLRITRKQTRNIINANYNIHGTDLELVAEAKYLGVMIDKKLNFNTHISNTIKKCDSTRAFLQRNLRGCSIEVKAASYKTFVRPIAEYAAPVWDPHLRSTTAADKLEAMQHRAARFVLNDWRRTSSITAMLKQLQWETLQARRSQIKLAMLQKILLNQIAIPTDRLPPRYTHQHLTRNATAGNRQHIHAPTHYKATFFPSVTALWNERDRSAVAGGDAELFQGQQALAQY